MRVSIIKIISVSCIWVGKSEPSRKRQTNILYFQHPVVRKFPYRRMNEIIETKGGEGRTETEIKYEKTLRIFI